MHYYKRNLGDYAKKAGRLTMLQHGAYTLLIDACYDRESFPTRDDAIDWAWACSAEEIAAVDFVLAKFFTLDSDGRYTQKRIQEEISEYQKFKELQAEKGKKGGRPKNPAGKNKNPGGLNKNPLVTRDKAEKSLTTNQEPLTTNQVKNTMSGKPDFEPIADRVIEELNRQAGKHFRLTSNNRGAVIARLREGFTEEDCFKVISNRCMRWLDTDQAQYLRPDTLFRPSKFEAYLNDTGATNAANRPTDQPKLTPAQRTEAKRQEAYRRESTGEPPIVGVVEADGRNVRPYLGKPAG